MSLLLGILRKHKLDASILDPHPLRSLFVRLFDPDYYGQEDIDDAVETSLSRVGDAGRTRRMAGDGKLRSSGHGSRRAPADGDAPAGPRKVESYREGNPGVVVGVVAANVGTREVAVLPEDTPIVEALLAATAVVPLLPPVEIGTRLSERGLFVDASMVANEPTRATLNYLRARVCNNSKALDLYPVAAMPVTKGRLGPQARVGGADTPYEELVDVVLRAMQLQQFRYSDLERRLVTRFTALIQDAAKTVFETETGNRYLRANVYPIEPGSPLETNRRLLLDAPSEAERRRVVAETVATGCRLALETMLPNTIRRATSSWSSPTGTIRCSEVIEQRRGPVCNAGADGPGVVEVCRECRIRTESDRQPAPTCRLRVPETVDVPEWPRAQTPPRACRFTTCNAGIPAKKSPNAETAGTPSVSLLFSGGVFRGVFQMGVLNALSELNLRPSLVAGASVGSITAAMAATVFAGDGCPDDPSRAQFVDALMYRRKAILRLAATYLAMDRLVLTDRFSDFIRNFTVRASRVGFSLRDLDRVFRRYDAPRPGQINREVRSVLAGLERLLHVSPFEALDLLEAERRGERKVVLELLLAYFQEFLNRSGARNEVLGAEPLELLIRELVLRDLGASPAKKSRPEKLLPFDAFGDDIAFLATATNLTQGCLEVLGHSTPPDSVNLMHGLLASSAFPGVFRPRWSWEVLADAARDDRYIDGGVMDNLPLDAVVHWLLSNDSIVRRPAGGHPHLLFTASLREDAPDLTWKEAEARYIQDWIALWKRTKTMAYNDKLDMFAAAQQGIRDIVDHTASNRDDAPLNLRLVIVKPNWLCGTFGFHPMLGFRKERQMRSIAHGCAATLREFARHDDEDREWLMVLGLATERLPGRERAADPRFEPDPGVRRDADGRTSDCWFKPGCICPFAGKQVHSTWPDAGPSTLRDLSAVHELCGDPETHVPKP